MGRNHKLAAVKPRRIGQKLRQLLLAGGGQGGGMGLRLEDLAEFYVGPSAFPGEAAGLPSGAP